MAAPLPLTDRSRVLVVDDERGPRESLRMILSGRYEVVTATRGAEALEILRTDSIDLVTVDLNMPGMKGDELMRTIRRESPQTEIIVITGCGSVESAIEGIRHGVFDYLTKPFDVVQVTASVERALERQASRARMVGFLEGLSRILGRNRDAAIVLEELEASPLAQERLRSVLSEPVLAGERRGSRPPSGRRNRCRAPRPRGTPRAQACSCASRRAPSPGRRSLQAGASGSGHRARLPRDTPSRRT